MDTEFKFFTAFVFLSIIGTIVLVISTIIKSNERSQIAQEHGCEYLGTARDLIGVSFYDCNGEIIMRRGDNKL